jgi:hypothetical protein
MVRMSTPALHLTGLARSPMNTAPPGAASSAGEQPSVTGVGALLVRVGRLLLREWAPGTARRNAWEAMCADAQRARERAEAASALAALPSTPPPTTRRPPRARPVILADF